MLVLEQPLAPGVEWSGFNWHYITWGEIDIAMCFKGIFAQVSMVINSSFYNSVNWLLRTPRGIASQKRLWMKIPNFLFKITINNNWILLVLRAQISFFGKIFLFFIANTCSDFLHHHVKGLIWKEIWLCTVCEHDLDTVSFALRVTSYPLILKIIEK